MLYIKTNWYWRENNHERGSLHKRLENIMTIIFLFFFLLFFLVWIGFLSHRLRVMYNKQWEQTPKVIRENRGGQSKKYLKTTVLVIASLRTKQQYWGTTTWNKSNPHTQKKNNLKISRSSKDQTPNYYYKEERWRCGLPVTQIFRLF